MANHSAWPSFYFTIRTIRVPDRQVQVIQGPFDNQLFKCDGQQIRPVRHVPEGLLQHSAFSAYFDQGQGQYFAVAYDISQTQHWMEWNPLWYRPNADGVSFLSPAAAQTRPRYGRPDQYWYRQLGLMQPEITNDPRRPGGLNGYVGLLLALIYLSVHPNRVGQFFTGNFARGQWHWPHPDMYNANGLGAAHRTNRSGAIVVIWVETPGHGRLVDEAQTNSRLF